MILLFFTSFELYRDMAFHKRLDGIYISYQSHQDGLFRGYMLEGYIDHYMYRLYYSGDSIYREVLFVYGLKNRGRRSKAGASLGVGYVDIFGTSCIVPYIEAYMELYSKNLHLSNVFFYFGVERDWSFGTSLWYRLSDFRGGISFHVEDGGLYYFKLFLHFNVVREFEVGVGVYLPHGMFETQIRVEREKLGLKYRLTYSELLERRDLLELYLLF